MKTRDGKKVRFHNEESRSAWSAKKKLNGILAVGQNRFILLTVSFPPAKSVTFRRVARTWTQFSRRFLAKHVLVAPVFRVIEGADIPPWAFELKRSKRNPWQLTLRWGKGNRPHVHALLFVRAHFSLSRIKRGGKRQFFASENIRGFVAALLTSQRRFSIGDVDLRPVTMTPKRLVRYLTKESRERGRAHHPRPEELRRVRVFEFGRARF